MMAGEAMLYLVVAVAVVAAAAGLEYVGVPWNVLSH